MIVVDPVSVLNVIVGTTIMLSVEADGFNLTYLWQHTDGRSLDNPRIEGTRSNRLRINEAEEEDAGGYVCEVTNAAGSVRSMVAVINISK